MTNTVKMETTCPYACIIHYYESDEVRATYNRYHAISYFRKAIQARAEKVELIDMTTGEILGHSSRQNDKLEIYVSSEILTDYENRG